MASCPLLVLLLSSALVCQAIDAGPSAPPGGAPIEALVNWVIDGSSLDAQVGGRRTAVGYLGVETPFPHQPCGAEALARNQELAVVRVLLTEDSIYAFDQAGRRLYHAYTADGVWIEAVLVSEGLARAVRTDAGRGVELAALQAEAEAAGRGAFGGG